MRRKIITIDFLSWSSNQHREIYCENVNDDNSIYGSLLLSEIMHSLFSRLMLAELKWQPKEKLLW